MPRVDSPADWIIERLKAKRPFFSARFNDGEMMMMYRTVPEGKVLGTDVSPATTNYELGDELGRMLTVTALHKEDVLIGCSWNTDRADELCKQFAQEVKFLKMEDANWCNEHWPLDGVVDGSTIRMLEALRNREDGPNILVTNWDFYEARRIVNAYFLPCPTKESWEARHETRQLCSQFASCVAVHPVFVWAAGIGLKPTAWRLWREFPQSSHIDVGHLFNGAFGLKDYGWLQRGDGPWHEPYFRPGGFADWVKSFLPKEGTA